MTNNKDISYKLDSYNGIYSFNTRKIVFSNNIVVPLGQESDDQCAFFYECQREGRGSPT